MEYSAEKIAAVLGGKLEGNKNVTVRAVSKIEEGKAGTLSFLANPKYTEYIYNTDASVVIVNNDFKAEKEIKATLIRVPDAYKAFADLLEIYNQSDAKIGVSEQASIHDSAKIGNGVFIGAFSVISAGVLIGNNAKIHPGAVISENASIGENTIIYPNVSVYKECEIGKNCIIHAGTVIGSDGFGFAPQKNKAFKKIPQAGKVIIEDNVEIGSNCSIDRATIGATHIKQGVKLDNLIQVAHNVVIDENTVIAAQTGVSGSTKIGKNNMIGGQVGFSGHIKIADNVKIGAQSGIHKDIDQNGSVMQGTPVDTMRSFYRTAIAMRKLPELLNRVNDLEQKIRALSHVKNKDNG